MDPACNPMYAGASRQQLPAAARRGVLLQRAGLLGRRATAARATACLLGQHALTTACSQSNAVPTTLGQHGQDSLTRPPHGQSAPIYYYTIIL